MMLVFIAVGAWLAKDSLRITGKDVAIETAPA
jgi:hypothetical protein